ncbi:MAG TPA: hypothetical protein VK660_10910, partial [Xanthomonadaceae bacterium]|nr:hypothetical protein [Xanthomonadaceae bacterium]
RIAVADTPTGPTVLAVVVNECVKNRHPVTSACPSAPGALPTRQSMPMTKEQRLEVTTRELAAIDMISLMCRAVNPEGNRIVLAKLGQAFFPDGEPPDAASIRASALYKKIYAKAYAQAIAAHPNPTPEDCSKL